MHEMTHSGMPAKPNSGKPHSAMVHSGGKKSRRRKQTKKNRKSRKSRKSRGRRRY